MSQLKAQVVRVIYSLKWVEVEGGEEEEELTAISAICFVSGYIAIGFQAIQILLRVVAIVWNFITVIMMWPTAAMMIVMMMMVCRIVAILAGDS